MFISGPLISVDSVLLASGNPQYTAVHTVLHSPVCLSGLYTVEKLSKCMLNELMKATALECQISNVCIILFSEVSIFEIIQINLSQRLDKATFYIAGSVIGTMFNFRSHLLFRSFNFLHK